jgi:hypothetical protein
MLYTDRMAPGREPIPVSEYRQGGQRNGQELWIGFLA